VISLEPRNAAPTGKTWERVKERGCFYASYFYSQLKLRAFISPEINRVQLVHNPLPRFGALLRRIFEIQTHFKHVLLISPRTAASSQTEATPSSFVEMLSQFSNHALTAKFQKSPVLP
jgi:hypothetical protein